MRRLLAASCFLLAVSCGEASTEPSIPEAYLAGGATGLLFTVDLSQTTIAIGQQSTMTIHLKNPKPTSVRINFTSGCQVLPYISAGKGSLVYPSGGGWGCPAVLSSLQIAANSEFTRTVTILGGAPSQGYFAGAALSPGIYIAYAEIADNQGRSNSVRFEVVK
jgi:hypothetical protein